MFIGSFSDKLWGRFGGRPIKFKKDREMVSNWRTREHKSWRLGTRLSMTSWFVQFDWLLPNPEKSPKIVPRATFPTNKMAGGCGAGYKTTVGHGMSAIYYPKLMHFSSKIIIMMSGKL